MPKIALLNTSGKKSGEINLPPRIFAAKVNEPLMAQAIKVYLTNQRKVHAKTKSRGEVSGSGRKIWRQKGTGRARHGDRYAPIFVGGGVAHGPRGNQNFKLEMSKKMKRAALFSSLSAKLKDKEILVVSGLAKVKPKTKEMARVLKNLQLEQLKTLLVMPAKLDNVFRAGQNIEKLNLIQADLLNTFAVLNGGKMVLMEEAVSKLEKTWI
ncbi:MAG TPA: 50S ribosomal protein L4 [Nevskiaceae bacterium]|nr:50S ribosomal protein L4 [Nevskiaceae bacterium]